MIQAFCQKKKKKQEKNSSNLNYHIKELEKEEQANCKVNRRKKTEIRGNKMDIENNRKK